MARIIMTQLQSTNKVSASKSLSTKATIDKLPNGKWVAFHAGKNVTAMCDTKKECLELIKGKYIITTNHEATYP